MDMKRLFTLSQLSALLFSHLQNIAQTTETTEKGNYKLKAVTELGFLGALSHKIQFRNNGTHFD